VGGYKEYTDNGFSGKNADRLKFQEMARDIKAGCGLQTRQHQPPIIDFANMMELLQKYIVEFVSSTEKLCTFAPMGRAMLNILLFI
jgi:DNA invertase Pin-like site-specific DNA recombinase